MGAYNHTFSAALWLPKFYLQWHPPAAGVHELRILKRSAEKKVRLYAPGDYLFLLLKYSNSITIFALRKIFFITLKCNTNGHKKGIQ